MDQKGVQFAVMSEQVVYSQTGKVVRISMNRAPANAYQLAFLEEIHAAFKRADESADVNVVILDSSIEKFFCAGADIKAFQENSVAENQKMVLQARANLQLMENSAKIFIAEINGHCLGGGLEIALACDFRFASDKAFLVGLPEIKLGLMPGNGGSQRLTKLIGITRAMEFLLTGDPIKPQQALDIGLFNRVVPVETLKSACMEFAQKLAEGPGLAMAATKRAVYTGAALSLPDALRLEEALVDSLYATEDAKEGFLAHLEKREPVFKGK